MITRSWLFVVLLSCPCAAQRSEPVALSVHVIQSGNQKAPEGTLIEVVDISGTIVGRGTIDGHGEAQLGRIAPGCYHIRPAHDWSVAAGSACMEIVPSPVPVMKEIYLATPSLKATGTAIPISPLVSIQSVIAPAAATSELAKARSALQKDRIDEAEKYAKRALKIHSSYPEAYNLLGIVFLRTGELNSARNEFQNAIRVDPKFADAYRNLARIAAAEANFAEAAKELNEALAIDPSDSETWTLLAFAQFERGQYAEALHSAERAHATDRGKSASAHFLAASVLERQGRLSEAIMQLQTYLREEPNGRYGVRSREILKHHAPQK
jgi:Flp pilus assembly protein TadD